MMHVAVLAVPVYLSKPARENPLFIPHTNVPVYDIYKKRRVATSGTHR